MKFKKDKHVIVISSDEKGKIILISYGNGYNQIKIYLKDSHETKWLHSSELELDKEYYRNKKLNKLLK